MTKEERKKLKKAIDYFLDDDPDKWVDGVDELFLLLYGRRYSRRFDGYKSVKIQDFLREIEE